MILEFFLIRNRISNYFRDIPQKPNEKVLDAGCGDSPYYHKLIKGRLIRFDIIKTDNVDVVGDADLPLPFKPNTFDKAISVNSFYYFKNPFNVVNNIANVLRRNGRFILVVPFFYPIHDAPVDKYRFTEYGLRTMMEDKFRIEKLETIGGILTIPSIFFHSAIKGFPLLFPKSLQRIAQIIAYALFPLYVISQFLSILDFLDVTKRVPTYYFVLASKK